MHTEPLQHPRQLVLSHVPPSVMQKPAVQTPLAHVTQSCPPIPQCRESCDVKQPPSPSQQPLAHVTAQLVLTQLPLKQL
jgi:hypothetical protein